MESCWSVPFNPSLHYSITPLLHCCLLPAASGNLFLPEDLHVQSVDGTNMIGRFVQVLESIPTGRNIGQLRDFDIAIPVGRVMDLAAQQCAGAASIGEQVVSLN